MKRPRSPSPPLPEVLMDAGLVLPDRPNLSL
uniref:Uncharacterized protein n=1 Tax=viral metagenome TaxID=1070528 RepID=A0A6C0IZ23_9ZZZZ